MYTGLSSPGIFIFSLMYGTLLSLSSTSWIFMWTGLEVNLMSFVPLLLLDKKTHQMEVAVKYFIIQAVGSIMVLYSFQKITPLLLFGLLLKTGAAPTHFWLISIIKRLPWSSAVILMTWQKIAPLAIMSASVSSSHNCVFLYIGVFNAWLGGTYAMAQTNPKTLLAYSSVANLGWMIALLPSKPLLFIFFMLYCTTLVPLMILLFQDNTFTARYSKMNFMHKTVISILLISLASVPPTPGFFMKWMTLPALLMHSPLTLPPLVLLLSAIPLAFAYLTLMFNMWLAPPQEQKTNISCISYLLPLVVLSLSLLILLGSTEHIAWMYNENPFIPSSTL